MTTLEKFMSLGDVLENDYEYVPYLNKAEGKWYIEWLLVDEIANYVEVLYDFQDENIDKAINKAYDWYNNFYLLGKGIEGFVKMKKQV